MVTLETPVSELRMIGPVYAARLKRLGLETVEDLLTHVPSRFENYSRVSKIKNLGAGETVTVYGTVREIITLKAKTGRKIQRMNFADDTGEIEIVFYNQPFLTTILRQNTPLTIAGTVKNFGRKLFFESPQYEIVKAGTLPIHTARLVPIYPQTEGVSSKWLRSRIHALLISFRLPFTEYLPPEILTRFDLPLKSEAINKIHFPDSELEAAKARKRLEFDELLEFHLASLLRKKTWNRLNAHYRLKVAPFQKETREFIAGLPFELTSSQKQAVKNILTDCAGKTPMNRLIEGDVGSGKTIVAVIVAYLFYLNKLQVAYMAPTEILARQHFETFARFLSPLGVKLSLQTGSAKINSEDFDIALGTHALIAESFKIPKLALVIIDEQQRFGVRQRAQLALKAKYPHVLTMTATPIPRTMALTIFADLDLTVMDELPKGRQTVKTWVVPPFKREAAYNWIKAEIGKDKKKKAQVFIVCPFIEESESLETVKAAKTEYAKLKKIFSGFRVGLLHGKLKNEEKIKAMDKFSRGLYDVLVTTPVVEVGIDIPGATVMLIEAADRFGLSSLHQLRGRVGRSRKQGYCLLFSEISNPKMIERLKLMEKYQSGPLLAEFDLKLRGPGEIHGLKQHGELGLKFAGFSDLALIENTQKAAASLLEGDPGLSRFPLLRRKLQKATIKNIAPD